MRRAHYTGVDEPDAKLPRALKAEIKGRPMDGASGFIANTDFGWFSHLSHDLFADFHNGREYERFQGRTIFMPRTAAETSPIASCLIGACRSHWGMTTLCLLDRDTR